MMNSNLDFIRGAIPTTELLAQLAEEASELSQAALKLRRCLGTGNPTPVAFEEALAGLHEEIADVALCLDTLGKLTSGVNVHSRSAAKLQRWVDRLRAAEGGDADG